MNLRNFFQLVLFLGSVSSHAQYLVSVTDYGNTPLALLKSISDSARYEVRYYKILYNTTDIDGSATVASGGLAVPVTNDCNRFPITAYCHGTVLHKEDVPSRENFESLIIKLFASVGMISVGPDYLGLGDNPGLHPYLHAETEATATIYLLRAAREFVEDSLNIILNSEVFVTGYSQGGHAAMATAKYIQEQNLLGEFNVKAVAPASGPYNLSGTQQEVLVSNQPYSNPGYVAYLLLSYQRVYGNLYSSYSSIFKSPYDTIIPPYFDGTYNMGAVNSALPNKLRDFVQDTVLDNFINDSVSKSHPLWQALLDNDNYDWNPSFPMELYYCTQDEQVDYQNALDAEAAMQANGASVTAVNKGALDHGGCVLPSLSEAAYFFKRHSQGCDIIGTSELPITQLKIFPNPAEDLLLIRPVPELCRYEIIRIDGQMVAQGRLREDEKINVQALTAGIYLIRLSSREGVAIGKFQKI